MISEEKENEAEKVRENYPGYGGNGAMSSERVPVELCKGINGLEKVVLREVRGSSAEVTYLSFSLLSPVFLNVLVSFEISLSDCLCLLQFLLFTKI